jgi:alpha-galactosidase
MYPLTGYTTGEDAWMAFQFDRPEEGKGLVQVFRRSQSIHRSADVPLRGLDPAATYSVIDMDADKPGKFTGRALMEKGVPVEITERPGAVVISYKKGH